MVLGSSIKMEVLLDKAEHGPRAAMRRELLLVEFAPVLPAAAVTYACCPEVHVAGLEKVKLPLLLVVVVASRVPAPPYPLLAVA
jgi:hypothetical protein